MRKGRIIVSVHVSQCVFCLIYYDCILSVTVFVCHDRGNGFSPFFTINSQVLYTGNDKTRKLNIIYLLFVINTISISDTYFCQPID